MTENNENNARRKLVMDFLEKSGWTITQLAKALDRSRSQIERYLTTKKSRNNVPAHIQEKIIDFREKLIERKLYKN